MYVGWQDEFSVGLPDIDGQHQEFLLRINDLIQACVQGKGQAQVRRTAAFLDSYVDHHFGFEEALMREKGYPALEDHLRLHRVFRTELALVKLDLDDDQAPGSLVMRMHRLLLVWFINHITTADQAFGVYLGNQPQET